MLPIVQEQCFGCILQAAVGIKYCRHRASSSDTLKALNVALHRKCKKTKLRLEAKRVRGVDVAAVPRKHLWFKPFRL